MLTLGSLFDGIGGWQLAAKRAGVVPKWSSEIDNFCLQITKHYYPETVQLGDIQNINGAKIEPVDIICAGSPCTNLSIANSSFGWKGLKGKESRLYYDAIRIVREMRKATGGEFPKLFIWENVQGAFSSNRGEDFRVVLQSIAGFEIPMPNTGRWSNAGMVSDKFSEVAWRSLDAKYFGVPQRRKRIFVVGSFDRRFGGIPSEILFEPQRVCGDSEECGESWKGDTATFEESPDECSKIMLWENHRQASRYRLLTKYCSTVARTYGCGGNNTPFVTDKELTYVRRLTPLEVERLQGLPDNYTLVDGIKCSNSARLRVLGNGMAQPIPDWLIKRCRDVLEEKLICK